MLSQFNLVTILFTISHHSPWFITLLIIMWTLPLPPVSFFSLCLRQDHPLDSTILLTSSLHLCLSINHVSPSTSLSCVCISVTTADFPLF